MLWLQHASIFSLTLSFSSTQPNAIYYIIFETLNLNLSYLFSYPEYIYSETKQDKPLLYLQLPPTLLYCYIHPHDIQTTASIAAIVVIKTEDLQLIDSIV